MDPDRQFASGQVKLVDFGNGCWVDRHFTDDIQTRQYRSPEVIVGCDYSTSADVWSVACLIFELATGDYLFDPRMGREYDRDEDHLALMMELLGSMPGELMQNGRYSQEYFREDGELRNIRRLRYWSLENVLKDKYRFSSQDAYDVSEFLLPMLKFSPSSRCTARDALNHQFLRFENPLQDRWLIRRSNSYTPSRGFMSTEFDDFREHKALLYSAIEEVIEEEEEHIVQSIS